MDIKGKESLEVNCKRNIDKIGISNLNINFFRNKFDSVIQQIMGNEDILIILKIKLDSSPSTHHFLINERSDLLRINRNNHWGGTM